jgi:hypothetical protein
MRRGSVLATLTPQLGVHLDTKSAHLNGTGGLTCLEWLNVCRVTRAGKRVENCDRHCDG